MCKYIYVLSNEFINEIKVFTDYDKCLEVYRSYSKERQLDTEIIIERIEEVF